MNKETEALNDWSNSDEGKSCANGESLGVPKEQGDFLRNRLWRAFTAGLEHGKRIRGEEIENKFARWLGNL